MKKTLALTVLLAVTLSGCAFQLRDPASQPDKTGSSPVQETDEQETDGGANPGLNASGACDDRDIVVDQDGARLVLTGHCDSVTITGTDVAVNIDTADEVRISGSEITLLAVEIGDATVTGMNVAINPDRVESIDLGGQYNTLISKYVGSLTISGDDNIANWDDGAASATDTGTGNTVVGP